MAPLLGMKQKNEKKEEDEAATDATTTTTTNNHHHHSEFLEKLAKALDATRPQFGFRFTVVRRATVANWQFERRVCVIREAG